MLTTKFLEAVALRSFMPTGQTTFTSLDQLVMADAELRTTILPRLLGVREEYTVISQDFPIMRGKAAYPIPARSIGLQLRDVHIVDGDRIIPDFPRTEPERIDSAALGEPTGFYLKGNNVMLFRTPASTRRILRLYFPLRPSRLVMPTMAAKIVDYDPDTNTVEVDTVPEAWQEGELFDFIKQDGGCECLSIDNELAEISGNVLGFNALPETLRVGDYIGLADESPLVQLPGEMRDVLAQATAARMLESMSQSGAKAARDLTKEMLADQIGILTPRTVGEERVIITNMWNI